MNFDFRDPELQRLAKLAYWLNAEMIAEIPLGNYAWTAGASLTSSQFLFATTDSSNNIVVNTTSGADCIGVIQDNPPSGDPVNVQSYGISQVVSGAAITAAAGGSPIMSDGAGKAIAATSSNHIMGYIFGPNFSTGTGVRVSVLLIHAGKM